MSEVGHRGDGRGKARIGVSEKNRVMVGKAGEGRYMRGRRLERIQRLWCTGEEESQVYGGVEG